MFALAGDVGSVALFGRGAGFGNDEAGAVVDGCRLLEGTMCNIIFRVGLPIPLANMLPFWKAFLNSSMLMPSSSMTSMAGRPEKRREKR